MFKKAIKLILFLCIANIGFSQTTLYEQKRIQLKKEFIEMILRENNTFTQENALELKNVKDESALDKILSWGFIGRPGFESEFDTRLKQLDKLKTKVDFDKERNEEAETEKAEKEIKYKESDYYRITNSIKFNYDKWSMRQNLEKNQEHKNRLLTESTGIIEGAVIAAFNFILGGEEKYHLEFDSKKYDSDKEKYYVSFKLDNWIADNSNTLYWNDTINIPIDKIKEYGGNISIKDFSINSLDLYFNNNNIYPKTISYELNIPNYELKTSTPISSTRNLKFKFAEFSDSVKLPELLNTSFDFNSLLKNQFNKVNPKIYIDSLNLLLKQSDLNTKDELIVLDKEDDFFNVSKRRKTLDTYKNDIKIKLINKVNKIYSAEHLNDSTYCTLYFNKFPQQKNDAYKKLLELPCYSKLDTFLFYREYINNKLIIPCNDTDKWSIKAPSYYCIQYLKEDKKFVNYRNEKPCHQTVKETIEKITLHSFENYVTEDEFINYYKSNELDNVAKEMILKYIDKITLSQEFNEFEIDEYIEDQNKRQAIFTLYNISNNPNSLTKINIYGEKAAKGQLCVFNFGSIEHERDLLSNQSNLEKFTEEYLYTYIIYSLILDNNMENNFNFTLLDHIFDRKHNSNNNTRFTKFKFYREIYTTVIDKFISRNIILKKEWEKRKDLFENNIDFLSSYLSSQYKEILKERKKM